MTNFNLDSFYDAITNKKMSVEISRYGRRFVNYNSQQIKINELVNVLFKEIEGNKDNPVALGKGRVIYEKIRDEFLNQSKIDDKKSRYISIMHAIRSIMHAIRSWFGSIGSGRADKMEKVKDFLNDQNIKEFNVFLKHAISPKDSKLFSRIYVDFLTGKNNIDIFKQIDNAAVSDFAKKNAKKAINLIAFKDEIGRQYESTQTLSELYEEYLSKDKSDLSELFAQIDLAKVSGSSKKAAKRALEKLNPGFQTPKSLPKIAKPQRFTTPAAPATVAPIAATAPSATLTKTEKVETGKITKDGQKLSQAAKTAYERIISKYDLVGGTLRSKDGKINTGITPNILFKAIEQGLKIEENNIVFTAQKIKIEEGGHTYKFYASENLEKFHFVEKKLGEGAFGRVFKTVELVNTEIRAVKKTFHKKEDDGSLDTFSINRANEQQENEYNVLTSLNKDGHQEGIPTPPSKVTYLESKREEGVKLGFMDMEVMTSDLNDSVQNEFINLSHKEQLIFLRSLLLGLEYMHKKGYIHRDLKPENCLVKVGPDGKPEKFVLADFGLAQQGASELELQMETYKISKTIIWILLGGKQKAGEDWHSWNNSSHVDSQKLNKVFNNLAISDDLKKVLRKGTTGKIPVSELVIAFNNAIAVAK